jgi:hypothetical protein
MTRTALAVIGAGLVAVLAGCGGGDDDGGSGGSSGGDFADQSAQQIVDAAQAALKDVDSVKVSGSIDSGGQQIGLDVQADRDGNCTGTVALGQGSAEILGVDGSIWFRPDEAFWRNNAGGAADTVIAAVGDKWVVVPQNGGGFTEVCDTSSLVDTLLEEDDSTYTKGETTQVDGDDVIAIEGKASGDDAPATGYVLLDDPHYLVKMEKTEGEDQGEVTFSEFGEDFDVQKPAKDEIVDLADLQGSAAS